MKVMGVDLEPGSSPMSLKQAKYSVVVLNDSGEVEYKGEEISLSKLIRLIWELKPNILALDNLYELGDEKSIKKLISLLPSELSIVQVTYTNREFKDLKELARENGIEVQGKISPSKAAYISAILALKGIGTKLRTVESKTKIIIRRGRALGPGGMSQNRYKRYLRGVVLRVMRKIKERLDSHGFDYDVVVKRSKSGLESATFIVYASRESLNGIIKKMKGHDVIVEIKPIYKTKIEFDIGTKLKKRPLIVGIDPGIEVGISALDLHGNLIFTISRRGIDREDIVNIISQYGFPVIIATDVDDMPELVKRLAATTGARLYAQSKKLSVEEKQEIVSEYIKINNGIKINDTHIRDSLAAAIRAYREVENKLRQAQGLISRLELDVDEEKVLECVAKHNTVSECIEREIEKVIESFENLNIIKEVKLNKNNSLIIKKEDEIIRLRREIEKYKKFVKSLILEKEYLEKKIDELKRNFDLEINKDRKVYELQIQIEEKNKYIRTLENKINELNSYINNLKNIINKILFEKYKIIKRGDSNNLFSYSGELYLLDEKVSKDIVIYEDENYVVIDEQLLKDLEILYKEKISSKSDNIDINKIIQEYRASRLKQDNFTLKY